VTPTAKNTGGGRPPKRLFLGRGLTRLAVSLRSPDAPIHAPTTLRTPASRASLKGRDSAVVMEPDGPQIDASSAALRLRPNNLLNSLARCCPQQRHGAGLVRRHWPVRAPHNPCCSVPEAAASQAPRASSQKAGTGGLPVRCRRQPSCGLRLRDGFVVMF